MLWMRPFATCLLSLVVVLCMGCGDGDADTQLPVDETGGSSGEGQEAAKADAPADARSTDGSAADRPDGRPAEGGPSHADGASGAAGAAAAGHAGGAGSGHAGAAGSGPAGSSGSGQAGSGGGPVQPVGSLRVMTYNIQHGGTLGMNLDAVASVIKAQNPDVCGLNEVQHLMPDSGFKKEAEDLAAKTGLANQYFGCTTNCGAISPGRYGIAMLSRYELTDRVKTFLPNQTDGSINMNSSIEPRVLLCGSIHPANVPAIRVCVTHLTNGDTADSWAIRKLQTQAIVNLLKPDLQALGGRVVLTGDMNSTPGSEPINLLTGLLADSWPEVGSGNGATIPSDAPTVRWDYVLHGSGFGKATSASVPNTTASDHRPVLVELPIMP
jgi:endonuclease/exonuclease/phosphatase family metal-dependent hydrolase